MMGLGRWNSFAARSRVLQKSPNTISSSATIRRTYALNRGHGAGSVREDHGDFEPTTGALTLVVTVKR